MWVGKMVKVKEHVLVGELVQQLAMGKVSVLVKVKG